MKRLVVASTVTCAAILTGFASQSLAVTPSPSPSPSQTATPNPMPLPVQQTFSKTSLSGAQFENPPPFAVLSQRRTSLLMALGNDRSITLRWQPNAQYISSGLTYELQRADGTPLSTNISSGSYVDTALSPSTQYTYILKAYRTTKPSAGKTSRKLVGQNTVKAETLPNAVVGLHNPTGMKRTIRWQPPVNASDTVTYKIYLENSLYIYDIKATEFRFPDDVLANSRSAKVRVTTVNSAGESKQPVQITVPFAGVTISPTATPRPTVSPSPLP